MYIEELHLQNIKCFKDLHIDFRDENDNPRKWTVLLGENGVGKSTLLQAVALCLCGHDDAERLLVTATTGRIARGEGTPEQPRPRDGFTLLCPVDGKSCSMAATFRVSEVDTPGGGDQPLTLVAYCLGASGWQLEQTRSLDVWHGSRRRELQLWDGADRGYFVCGYGPARRQGQPAMLGTNPIPRGEARLATLFVETELLTPGSTMLRQAHYRSLAAQEAPIPGDRGRQLEAMTKALRGLLPEVGRIEVGPEQVLLETPFGELSPEQLSDGYRAMLAWVLDLIGHLADAFPDSDDLLACEGVVLVDEVDAHLHPAWQRDVIFTLRDTFPNLQFIVTTHSPLTVQGARDGEVVVLRRDGSKVVADTDLASVQGWRADQVLTSDLFGLETTRDPGTEKALNRRRGLLAKKKRTAREQAELEALGQELTVKLPPSGDTAEERTAQQLSSEVLEILQQQIPEESLAKAKADIEQELRPRTGGTQARKGDRQ